MDLLSRTQHSNIISLLGCSIDGDTRFIVYELMQNGSLEAQLHGKILKLLSLTYRNYTSQFHSIFQNSMLKDHLVALD